MKRCIVFLALVLLLATVWLPTDSAAASSHLRTLPTSGSINGYYYLSSDAKLSSTLNISGGTSYICLNGYTLDCSSYGITVGAGATLIIEDCAGGGVIVVNNPSRVSPSAVEVSTGGTLHFASGGISVQDTSTYGTYASAIANSGGTVTISGGSFTAHAAPTFIGNYSSSLTLVQAYGGTTNITGGSFTATVSTSTTSGTVRAVCAHSASNGILNITGGSFVGNNYSSVLSWQRCPYPILVQNDQLYLGGSPSISGIVCLYSFYGPSNHYLHAKSYDGQNYTGNLIQLGCVNGSYSSHKLLVDDLTEGVNTGKFTLSSTSSMYQAHVHKDHLVFYTSSSYYCSVSDNDGGVVAKEPTCSETGVKTYTCKICYATKQETLSKKSHAPVTDKAVAPTCVETGLTEGSHCFSCGEIITAQDSVPATGHSEVTINAVPPTCGETGLTEGVQCTVCEEFLTPQAIIPATGAHDYQLDERVEPTCTEEGYTTYTCGSCSHSYEADHKAALGHQYMTAFSWKTNFSVAMATAVCDICGDEQNIDCTITCHWDQINCRLKFTASAVLGDEVVTDDSQFIHLLYSEGKLSITNSVAEADEKTDMIIVVAGYTSGGQMTGCQIFESVSGLTEITLTVTGDRTRVFFLEPDTYAPLFMRVEL